MVDLRKSRDLIRWVDAVILASARVPDLET